MTRHKSLRLAWIGMIIFILVGCQTAYYTAWEQVGKEKRHLLRDNVEKAGEEQKAATEQFQDVLTQIQTLYKFEGGDLEKAYRRLKSDYEVSEERAQDVRDRIAKVEQIANDMFKEWQQEIDEMSSPELKAKSRQSLRDTQRRYAQLEQAMRRVERRMDPVLVKVRDYVLFLKHNLNAQAMGALEQEVGQIQVEVDSLIADLNKSIQESNSFLKEFNGASESHK